MKLTKDQIDNLVAKARKAVEIGNYKCGCGYFGAKYDWRGKNIEEATSLAISQYSKAVNEFADEDWAAIPAIAIRIMDAQSEVFVADRDNAVELVDAYHEKHGSASNDQLDEILEKLTDIMIPSMRSVSPNTDRETLH